MKGCSSLACDRTVPVSKQYKQGICGSRQFKSNDVSSQQIVQFNRFAVDGLRQILTRSADTKNINIDSDHARNGPQEFNTFPASLMDGGKPNTQWQISIASQKAQQVSPQNDSNQIIQLMLQSVKAFGVDLGSTLAPWGYTKVMESLQYLTMITNEAQKLVLISGINDNILAPLDREINALVNKFIVPAIRGQQSGWGFNYCVQVLEEIRQLDLDLNNSKALIPALLQQCYLTLYSRPQNHLKLLDILVYYSVVYTSDPRLINRLCSSFVESADQFGCTALEAAKFLSSSLNLEQQSANIRSVTQLLYRCTMQERFSMTVPTMHCILDVLSTCDGLMYEAQTILTCISVRMQAILNNQVNSTISGASCSSDSSVQPQDILTLLLKWRLLLYKNVTSWMDEQLIQVCYLYYHAFQRNFGAVISADIMNVLSALRLQLYSTHKDEASTHINVIDEWWRDLYSYSYKEIYESAPSSAPTAAALACALARYGDPMKAPSDLVARLYTNLRRCVPYLSNHRFSQSLWAVGQLYAMQSRPFDNHKTSTHSRTSAQPPSSYEYASQGSVPSDLLATYALHFRARGDQFNVEQLLAFVAGLSRFCSPTIYVSTAQPRAEVQTFSFINRELVSSLAIRGQQVLSAMTLEQVSMYVQCMLNMAQPAWLTISWYQSIETVILKNLSSLTVDRQSRIMLAFGRAFKSYTPSIKFMKTMQAITEKYIDYMPAHTLLNVAYFYTNTSAYTFSQPRFVNKLLKHLGLSMLASMNIADVCRLVDCIASAMRVIQIDSVTYSSVIQRIVAALTSDDKIQLSDFARSLDCLAVLEIYKPLTAQQTSAVKAQVLRRISTGNIDVKQTLVKYASWW